MSMVSDFNDVFNDVILHRCEGKKVLCTLSGGLDTRLILSVFCNHGIPVNAFTFNTDSRDMKIAQRIAMCCPVVKEHIVWDDVYSEWDDHRVEDLFNSYDVVLNGGWMSSCFDRFDRVDLSDDGFDKLMEKGFKLNELVHQRCPSVFFPGLDERVIEALRFVPLKYRFFGYLQKEMIRLNYPLLMAFGWTSWNLKKRIARMLYWNAVRWL